MLRLEDLTKAYGDRVLLAGVSYHFPAGERLALVGANGAGKTTLLNILCGVAPADSGRVTAPAKLKIGYLPQKPNPEPEPTVLAECVAGARELVRLKQTMATTLAKATEGAGDKDGDEALHRYEEAETAFRLAGGYSAEARATSIMKGLGFRDEDVHKDPKTLSGGWRMRLELGRLFMSEPDFLVLDEPTNHLDLPSLVWVEQYLQSYRGTLLFVSHDRALLNRLATITLHLHRGQLTPYTGNFDAFLDARERRLEQEQAQADQLRRRREEMERFVERFGAKASKASQARSRMKMIARLRDLEADLGPGSGDDDGSLAIQVPEPPKTPRVVVTVEHGAIGYGATTLARGLELVVERGFKVAIIGANGIGKSTLLKTLAGVVAPLAGSFAIADGVAVAYCAQDQGETLDPKATVLENALKSADLSEKQARQLLGAFLFRGDDVYKRTSVLSGGEASRLGLAGALAKRAGLLLLDEPTNHLDMASVEALAASLGDYTGTAVFVSHDRGFIDSVATHVFAMLPDGRSRLFEGKLDDYERLAAASGFPNILHTEQEVASQERAAEQKAKAATAGASGGAPGGDAEAKELKRTRQRLQNRMAQCEKDQAATQAEIQRLDTEVESTAGSDFVRLTELGQKAAAARAKLQQLEESWLESATELETATARLQALGRLD
jgi:ATP-binding cassette subfamily F protein 3